VSAQAEAVAEGQRIVGLAIARAQWIDEQDFASEYQYAMWRQVRRFGGDGSVRNESIRTYEVVPVDGVPFRRLLTRNGEPLSESERAAELEREKSFIEELRNPEAEEDDDDDGISFSADLVSRYQFRLEGTEEVNGRPSYHVSFQPKSGSLPVRRSLDHAMNKARGELWVDRALYEVARVRFELIEKVRIWWGIVGSISAANGLLERQPVSGDEWMATELHTYVHTRIIFTSTRREETTKWSDYKKQAPH
jgi:hypothetical protein